MSRQVKASKPPKDPNAPQKPPSAFFIYLREAQPQVRRELQKGGKFSVSNDIVAKECGKRWQNLDPKLKQKYHNEQRLHKLRYEEEMKTYKQSPDVVAAANIANIANIARQAKNKDPTTDLPQMFRDYFGFLVSNWEVVALGMPNDSPAEVQQTIWNIWSGSRTVTKDEGVDTTLTLDTNFNMTQQQELPFVPVPMEDSKPLENSFSGSPSVNVTPPKLAFHFFVDAIKAQPDYQENPLTESQIIRLCQERWDGMTEQEMKCFNVMELQDIGRYERELAMARKKKLETPGTASRRRKRPVREAAVKAVNYVSGEEDDNPKTSVNVKKEKLDNDDTHDSMLKQENMKNPYGGDYPHQGVDHLFSGYDTSSDKDTGKLEINENYATSDEY